MFLGGGGDDIGFDFLVLEVGEVGAETLEGAALPGRVTLAGDGMGASVVIFLRKCCFGSLHER